MSGILIIGASHSGVATAAALRTAKYDGKLTLITEESVLPYHRPPLSKEALSKKDYIPTLLRPEIFYSNNQIELVQGVKVSALNIAERSATAEDGTTYSYDRLILACGAEPRRLSVSVDPDRLAHYLRTHNDLIALRSQIDRANSMVIIGGGLIGMEIAAMALAQGLGVTIVEAGSRIMERSVSKAVANYVLDRHSNKGLVVRFDSSVAFVHKAEDDRTSVVTLADGEELRAEIIVAGIGTAPHETLAREAGLEVNNGIAVSEVGLTSDSSIYAVGDCSAWYDPGLGRYVRNEAVNPGQDQAKIVAATVMGLDLPQKRPPRYWSHQAEIQIQMSGDVNGTDMEAVLNAPASGAFSVLGFKDDHLVAIQTINAPQQFGKLHDMLGMSREAIASALDVEFPPPHHH